MEWVAEFVRVHREAIEVFYGLAFVLLGTTILLQPKEQSSFPLSRVIPLLAGFALLHGFGSWLELPSPGGRQGMAIDGVRVVLLVAAFGLLLEFGRRLAERSVRRPWLQSLLTPASYVPLLLALGLWAGWGTDPLAGLEVGARYVVGLTGSVLAGLGLLAFARRQRVEAQFRRAAPHLKRAGWAFLGFATIGGLAVVPDRVAARGLPDGRTFEAWVGLPVELFRGVFAVLLLVAISSILRVYQAETRDRLKLALRRTEASLNQIRRLSARNRLILEAAGQGMFGLDVNSRITFVNSAAVEMLGYGQGELVGRVPHDVVLHTRADGTPYPRERCPILETIDTGAACHVDTDVFWRKNGTSFEVEYTSTPIRESGKILGAVVSFRDVTARHEAEKHLRQAALVIEQTPECVMVTDPDGRILSVNPAFLARTGYPREEVIGNLPRMLRSDHHPRSFYETMWESLEHDGQWQGEIWNRRKNGEIYPEWLSINVLKDEQGKVINYVGIYSDINTHQEVQRRLHHLAYYDALTGLPNRQLFSDRLGLALTQSRRDGNLVGLMFLDLDRFKNINDTLGHSVGDRLLKAIARRLRTTVREGDTIARIGGDEFTVMLPGLQEPQHAATVASKILDALGRPVALEDREFYITGSIGISICPHDGEDLESLTRKADIAMYRAKELGRNNYQFFRPDMSERFHQRLALENDLRRAVDNDELYLVYQPQVDVRDGRVVGVEALARWCHPELGEIPPATFIPIAEEIGLIGRIGEWGLRTACGQAREWFHGDGQVGRVAVNLSAHQLREGGLADQVAAVLAESGLEPRFLALELTESVLMDNSELTVATLGRLVGMGVQIAIDDFGTGYSSLSYLKRFSIDKLKIDQSFVRDIPRDANDRALAAMIIAVAHASNIKVTAEGVEENEQLEFLREQGCDEVQGFLFSRPVPAADIGRMLERGASLERPRGRGQAWTAGS